MNRQKTNEVNSFTRENYNMSGYLPVPHSSAVSFFTFFPLLISCAIVITYFNLLGTSINVIKICKNYLAN